VILTVFKELTQIQIIIGQCDVKLIMMILI